MALSSESRLAFFGDVAPSLRNSGSFSSGVSTSGSRSGITGTLSVSRNFLSGKVLTTPQPHRCPGLDSSENTVSTIKG